MTTSPLLISRLHRFACIAGMALVLGACGGGGGSGGEAPAARSWQTAQRLEEAVPTVLHHAVAIGANGVGYAAWSQFVAGQSDMFFRRYSAGVWSAPQTLPNDNLTADARLGQVVVHADGEATAVWVDELTTGQQQVMAAHTAGGVWQLAFKVDEGPGAVNDLGLVKDDAGSVMAVWVREQTVLASRAAAKGLFEPPEQISVGTTGQAKSARVAMNGAGEALAVWVENHLGVPRVTYVAFRGGAWNAAQVLNLDFTEEGRSPTVAMGRNGRAVVVWGQSIGGEAGIVARAASDAFANQWDTAEQVALVRALSPQVALDPAGRAMVVWQQNEFGTTTSVFAARHDGVRWLPAALIEFDDTDHATEPRIASDASGNMLTVWRQTAAADDRILSNRFDAAAGVWRQPERIEIFNGEDSRFPELALNASGEAVAVWLIQRQGGFDLAGNVFK